MLQVEISGIGVLNGIDGDTVFGEEIKKLISHKLQEIPNSELNKIVSETTEILKPCLVAQRREICETILVVGYVQSGKTLSFTALTALAKDNGYKTIVIISGTTNTLNDQTYKRMKEDLSPNNNNTWVILQDPTQEDQPLITSVSTPYKSDFFLEKSLVIVVKKNGSNLLNLFKTISKIKQILDKPTLIIDDESDQASLNTKAAKDDGTISTINKRIKQIRSLFKNHTFLQYTATPQANLFINYLDSLSPNYIKFITPGEKYTGGETFFVEKFDKLVQIIPKNELPTNETMDRAPKSLVTAMMYFVVGIAIRRISENRHITMSMMVHPSRTTVVHYSYYRSIVRVRDGWKSVLGSKDEKDKKALLHDFEEVFNKLMKTLSVDIKFSSISDNILFDIITCINIQIINASNGKTPPINWDSSHYHIIIGGTTLDRGTTIQGLTVTYMPRSLGLGQVDTTLQRARFFGYKKDYLGYCRVWIDQETAAAYHDIVIHERDVRNRLIPFAIEEKRLEEWNREVILSDLLKLTRPAILSHEIYRGRYSEWSIFNYPCESENMVKNNFTNIAGFIEKFASEFYSSEREISSLKKEERHLYLRLSYQSCLNELLEKVVFEFPYEEAKYQGLKSILTDCSNKSPQEEVQIVLIGGRRVNNEVIQTCRERSTKNVKTSIRINQLFQGRDPKNTNRYPGDSEFFNPNLWTIQIHKLTLKTEIPLEEIDKWKGSELFTLAVRAPKSFETDTVFQSGNSKNAN